MKRSLVFAAVLITLIALGVKAYNTPFNPCDTPLTYKIGTIDPKFKLKQSDVLADTDNAAKIFDKAYGKDLFSFKADTGELTINFVYDQRTALEENINSQQNQIGQKNTTLQAQIKDYESDVDAFMKRLSDLNATIQKYNAQGGAPPDVYNSLIDQQNKLRAEGDALNARAKQLNLETNNYNTQVNSLNQKVTQFNEAIAQKPEEGQYNGATKTITIFFVDNKPELIHTLAHEFGHALGMDHVGDTNAIMYPLTSKSLSFTGDDRKQLEAVCQTIPLPQQWAFLIFKKYYEMTSKDSGTINK